MITELVAAIIGFSEIETFEEPEIFEKRCEELAVTLVANATDAFRNNKDLFDRVFPEDNPHLQILRKYIEEVDKMVN